MTSLARLAGWIVVSFMPAAIGVPFTAPEWYRSLRRPSWAPPAWLFGPVWSVLYLLMAIAAWRTDAAPRSSRGALTLFGMQLALNAAWTPIFFGLRRIDLAFIEIVAMPLDVAVIPFHPGELGLGDGFRAEPEMDREIVEGFALGHSPPMTKALSLFPSGSRK